MIPKMDVFIFRFWSFWYDSAWRRSHSSNLRSNGSDTHGDPWTEQKASNLWKAYAIFGNFWCRCSSSKWMWKCCGHMTHMPCLGRGCIFWSSTRSIRPVWWTSIWDDQLISRLVLSMSPSKVDQDIAATAQNPLRSFRNHVANEYSQKGLNAVPILWNVSKILYVAIIAHQQS